MKIKGHVRKASNKFLQCLKALKRGLRRARDGYINVLTSCGSSIHQGDCPSDSHFPGQYYELPRSVSSEEDVLREPSSSRVESVTSSSCGNETDMFSPKLLRMKMRSRGLPKNMGTIDEDKPCKFQDDDVVIVQLRSKFGSTSRNRIINQTKIS